MIVGRKHDEKQWIWHVNLHKEIYFKNRTTATTDEPLPKLTAGYRILQLLSVKEALLELTQLIRWWFNFCSVDAKKMNNKVWCKWLKCRKPWKLNDTALWSQLLVGPADLLDRDRWSETGKGVESSGVICSKGPRLESNPDRCSKDSSLGTWGARSTRWATKRQRRVVTQQGAKNEELKCGQTVPVRLLQV